MINQDQLTKIRETTGEFLGNMTISGFLVEASASKAENQDADVVDLKIKLDEAQFLIGQNGQTLFELERILKIILSKKLQTPFYLRLDINDYKKKKIDYLKNLAMSLADEVAQSKQERILEPMPAYQRRIIHMELANRQDISTESRGDSSERYIVIKPK